MVICIWRYLDEQKQRYLYVLAAVLALSFATKEVTFITVAIFLVFLDLMLAVEFGKRREGEDDRRRASAWHAHAAHGAGRLADRRRLAAARQASPSAATGCRRSATC